MAVMAKWRNKTFEVSRKKVNPLKNFSTSTTIKGDDSKSKKKKTELVPFTFDIDVHANAGVNPQKEYESWCSLIKSTGVLYLHGRRFGRETRLKEVSLSGVIMDDYGRICFATIGLTFEEVNKKETSGKTNKPKKPSTVSKVTANFFPDLKTSRQDNFFSDIRRCQLTINSTPRSSFSSSPNA